MTVLKQGLATALVLACALALIPAISGCSTSESDPSKQTIPTDSNQWQKSSAILLRSSLRPIEVCLAAI